jgi:hypothetical protein
VLSRSRSVSYCPDVGAKNTSPRPALIVDDRVPSLFQIPSRDSAIGDMLLGAKSKLLQDPPGSDRRDAQATPILPRRVVRPGFGVLLLSGNPQTPVGPDVPCRVRPLRTKLH